MLIAIYALSGVILILLFFFVWYVVTTNKRQDKLIDRIMAKDLPEYAQITRLEQPRKPTAKKQEEQPPRRRNENTVTLTDDEVDVCQAQAAFKSIVGE